MCLRRAKPGARVLGKSRKPSPAEAQRRRAINKQQFSLRLSVSAGKLPPSWLPGGGDAGTLRRNSEGHLAQRRRAKNKREPSPRLSVSAGKSPPSRLPGGSDIGILWGNHERQFLLCGTELVLGGPGVGVSTGFVWAQGWPGRNARATFEN